MSREAWRSYAAGSTLRHDTPICRRLVFSRRTRHLVLADEVLRARHAGRQLMQGSAMCTPECTRSAVFASLVPPEAPALASANNTRHPLLSVPYVTPARRCACAAEGRPDVVRFRQRMLAPSVIGPVRGHGLSTPEMGDSRRWWDFRGPGTECRGGEAASGMPPNAPALLSGST